MLLLGTSDDWEREEDLIVWLRSATGYQRLKKVIEEISMPVIFHPDPGRKLFVARDSVSKLGYIYTIVTDGDNPSKPVIKHIGSSDMPVKHTEFFNVAQTEYLLMGTNDDKLEIWRVNKNPHRIFTSQVGLTGFLKLPGEGRFLLWYDDGRSYVIDVQLINLAKAASESGDTKAIRHYIEENLFKSNWLNPVIIDEQRTSMRLD